MHEIDYEWADSRMSQKALLLSYQMPSKLSERLGKALVHQWNSKGGACPSSCTAKAIGSNRSKRTNSVWLCDWHRSHLKHPGVRELRPCNHGLIFLATLISRQTQVRGHKKKKHHKNLISTQNEDCSGEMRIKDKAQFPLAQVP